MSHLKFQRKRTQSPRIKMHSEESHGVPQKLSVQRIFPQNIMRRRMSTQNSPIRYKRSDQTITASSKASLAEAKKEFKEKNIKKALVIFKQLFTKNPRSAQISYYIGSCLLGEGKYESSLHYFKLCYAIDASYDRNTFLYIAVNHKALGNYVQAIMVLKEAVEKYPKFEQAYFYKAKMHSKLGEIEDSIACFKKCLSLNKSNDLVYIFYGDNLKIIHRVKQALQKYNKAIELGGAHLKMATLKKIDILIQLERYSQGQYQIQKGKKFINSPVLTFYQGLIDFQKQKYADAVISLEIGLTSNLNVNQLLKAFKTLFNICIEEKNFFQAQHLLNRVKKYSINEKLLSHYFYFIEGVNDLIKRKTSESLQKLKLAQQKIFQLQNKQKGYLLNLLLPFLAYNEFIENNLEDALAAYQKYLQKCPNNKTQLYNKIICEGLLLNRNRKFQESEQKFIEAENLQTHKIQPYFLRSISIIQQLKFQLIGKEEALANVYAIIKKSSEIKTLNSLFLFYQTLVKLFQGEDAYGLICYAIEVADEDISEYFFIKGLCCVLKGQTVQGLEAISKAIELDRNIPQFFKQKSKYFYILERYEEACEEMERLLDNTDDDQARLLLTFYYYMNDQYRDSYKMLRTLGQNKKESKFKEFEFALHFRLGEYEKCGFLGEIMGAIMIKEYILKKQTISEMEKAILSRDTLSQFTPYHLHLLLAVYRCYSQKFDESLQHLFGALEQIQYYVDDKEEFTLITEAMLTEIKFNIVIVSFLRQKGLEKPETLKYIEVFIAETDSEEFVTCMKKLMEIIEGKKSGDTDISLYDDSYKISDRFPEIVLKVGQRKIKTRLLMLFPQKLKFNIAPEFDDYYLYNFDMDKVEGKLCPPWFKLHHQQLLFTDKLRNESILLSETEKAQTPRLVVQSPDLTLRDKFKLDDAVEMKLQKLLKPLK